MYKIDPLLIPWSEDLNSLQATDLLTTPPEICYHYTSLDRGIKIIKNQQLYFSSPTSFNDPFDMHEDLINYDIDISRAKIFTDKVRPNFKGIDRDVYIKSILDSKSSFINEQKKVFINDRSKSGVCCFSKKYNVSLMWSHYADSHNGISFGFNFEPYRPGIQLLVQPVKYAKKITSVNVFDDSTKALFHWIFTKSHIWSYEMEVRAFSLYRNGLTNFDKRCLKEVYFGCRVSYNQIEEIIAILKENYNHTIKCFQMKVDASTFKVKSTPLITVN